jgi:hypothetical protein
MLTKDSTSQYSNVVGMSRKGLEAEYKKLWGEEPPPNTRTKQLRDFIMAEIGKQQTTTNNIEKKTERLRGNIKHYLKPGEERVREFKHKKWKVRGLPGGKVECEGVQYESLSAIAIAITGYKVSGPDFFGVTGKNKGRFGRG